MNRLPSNGEPRRALFASLRLKDFDVCWAGPSPILDTFCFGSEDGSLLFTDRDGLVTHGPMPGSFSGEAINGVASFEGWLAVSTRAEVTTGKLCSDTEQPGGVVVFHHGAHGIAASPSGYFVAPLGRTGIMMLRAGSNPSDRVSVLTSNRPEIDFYRVIVLPGVKGRDVLVSACLRGGIGITEVEWGQEEYLMHVGTSEGMDVVDVAAIGSDSNSLAVAALGRDGTLMLVRDALQDKRPVTLKYKTVSGTAYRLLHCRGHVFVLTSKGLYGLFNLAQRYLEGVTPGGPPLRILRVEMEASDARVVKDRWLLVVLPDEVRRFDVQALEQDAPEYVRSGEMKEAQPESLDLPWKEEEISQTASQLLMAGTA
jgi:hypothetical protein